jgi:hypothetical protein
MPTGIKPNLSFCPGADHCWLDQHRMCVNWNNAENSCLEQNRNLLMWLDGCLFIRKIAGWSWVHATRPEFPEFPNSSKKSDLDLPLLHYYTYYYTFKIPKTYITMVNPFVPGFSQLYSVTHCYSISALNKYSYISVFVQESQFGNGAKIMNSAFVQIFNFGISPEIGNSAFHFCVGIGPKLRVRFGFNSAVGMRGFIPNLMFRLFSRIRVI